LSTRFAPGYVVHSCWWRKRDVFEGLIVEEGLVFGNRRRKRSSSLVERLVSVFDVLRERRGLERKRRSRRSTEGVVGRSRRRRDDRAGGCPGSRRCSRALLDGRRGLDDGADRRRSSRDEGRTSAFGGIEGCDVLRSGVVSRFRLLGDPGRFSDDGRRCRRRRRWRRRFCSSNSRRFRFRLVFESLEDREVRVSGSSSR